MLRAVATRVRSSMSLAATAAARDPTAAATAPVGQACWLGPGIGAGAYGTIAGSSIARIYGRTGASACGRSGPCPYGGTDGSSDAGAFGLTHASAGAWACGSLGGAGLADGDIVDATRRVRRRERSAGASGAPRP